MKIVILTALGVGFSTILGGILGFIFKSSLQKFSSSIMGFANGVMLSASIFGLIIPALECSLCISILGIFFGAIVIFIVGKFVPNIDSFSSLSPDVGKGVLLFVIAIAIHNLPEGIATGVAFGSEDLGQALTVAIGIALQNLPEGMVIISPLLSLGFSKRKTFLIALFTGLSEIIGTFFGYFAIGISSAILPFFLAFAGGCMLYVINDDMLKGEKSSVFSLLFGFCLMIVFNALI